MNKLFDGVSVVGIVVPGEAYIFSEKASPAWDPGPISYLYVIKKDEEILPALEMEFCTVLAEMFEIRKFSGMRRVTDDCYEFRTRCFEREVKEEQDCCLYLHRLRTFKERFEQVNTIYVSL
jgi:hypothetical protein